MTYLFCGTITEGGGVTGYLLKEGMSESANEQIIKPAYSSPTLLYKYHSTE